MIHNLYVVRKNGICIFHKKFGSLEEDPQSMAGFLTAISMFSKATVGEDIRVIATDNFKFTFKGGDEFTFIAFADTSDDNSGMQDLLQNVEVRFRDLFPHAEDNGARGNLMNFKAFEFPLETLIDAFHQDN